MTLATLLLAVAVLAFSAIDMSSSAVPNNQQLLEQHVYNTPLRAPPAFRKPKAPKSENSNVPDQAKVPKDLNENVKSKSEEASASALERPVGPFANAKTLYIVMGNLRGGELAWKSLKENVLDYNPDTDLALMIGETRPEYANASLFGLARYHWTFPEYDDWADAIDELNGTAWRQTALPSFTRFDQLLGGIKAGLYAKRGGETRFLFQGSGALIFMIRYWLSQQIQKLKLTNIYDRFVITRSDHFYKCSHDLSWLNVCEHVYIPQGEEYGGYTDRHLIVGKQHILTALDVLPHMLQYPHLYQDFSNQVKGGDKYVSPETALQRRWHLAGLLPRRHARTFFTCAVPGDTTRWKKMVTTKRVEGGVFLKYPLEYTIAKSTCGKRTSTPTKKKTDSSPLLLPPAYPPPRHACLAQLRGETEPNRTLVRLQPKHKSKSLQRQK